MAASKLRRRRQPETPSEPASSGLENGTRSGHKRRRAEAEGSPGRETRRSSKRIRSTEKRRRVPSDWRRQKPGLPAPVRLSDYVVPDRPSPPFRSDDKDGHFQFELGDNLASRYKVLSKMGEGTFGRVLECWDRKNKDYVAIKIIRNLQKYRDAAMIELEVLNILDHFDLDNKWHCVGLKDWFDYRGHVCMVFERLGPSLFDFLRRNSYHPFHVDLVRSFGRQMLESIAYIHELTLVHTDLKPENILLQSGEYDKQAPPRGSKVGKRIPASSQIRVIDFGSATFEDQYHSKVVSTRHYRAPEVILGLGWSYPCDLWSAGCILYELATGDALFQTHDNMEHLAMMERVLGPLPTSMVRKASRTMQRYFTSRHLLAWPPKSADSRSLRAVAKLASLQDLIEVSGDVSCQPCLDSLVDVISGMLKYDPEARLSADEALQHKFFAVEELPNGSSSAPHTRSKDARAAS